MSKAKITKLSICLVLVLALVGGGIVYYNVAGKKGGEVTDQAASRGENVPDDGVVYIEPELVSLAGALSGNANSQAAAKAAFDLVNAKRKEAGLGALTWDSGLEQASAVRAVEASQFFSHTRPDGSDWWTVNSNLMYGENLAKGYASADEAVTAWMNSPTHKANIMDTEFTSGAIAIHIGSNGQWFWAQEFGF
ncbi:MAG: CAP domain-containing protein [Lachnospiraceae bacterium]|nr:CAP domain-containing protein [Lachnospiraceae bacterium]